MIPELGRLALMLALAMALVQSCWPLYGMAVRRPVYQHFAAPAAIGQCLMLSIAFAALAWSFYVNDFSVVYVAENSNTHLPWFYRLAAVWGAHEGSLLLWLLELGLWSLAVVCTSRSLPRDVAASVLSIMGLVGAGFLLFTLTTSDPFQRRFPAPSQGRDLNPLLQDPGLVLHPPMLYMGYVGFCVAFAFAITALLSGRVDSAWTRWARPWTLAAWVCLTLGIILGSGWAYNELGWGGWWFWDPVENASFMPWLVGTALIHSLAVTEKRGIFQSWTVLLAITTFALSLLGTFLVRSGVLVSVHAFASDPARGVYMLALFAIVVGGALVLYALRAGELGQPAEPAAILSREGLLLLNNLFLVVAAASVLIGTLYPILADALGLGQLSVGAPYFNQVFVPLMAPLVVLVGLASAVAWKRTRLARLKSRLWGPALAAVVAGGLLPALTVGLGAVPAVAGSMLGCWVIASSVEEWLRRRRTRSRLSRQVLGMTLAHAGVGVLVIGISLVSGFGSQRQARMAPGDTLQFAGYDIGFRGTQSRRGPNYMAQIGEFAIQRAGRQRTTLRPAKRRYHASGAVMTEAGIDNGLFGDLYVSLGDSGPGGYWSVRFYDRPFVRWIWSGGLLAALGGLIALTDKRYRRPRPVRLGHWKRADTAVEREAES
ncbi:heme lyase CcmF/NrfE family subunit [Salinisphaera sp. SPP-AMP-43]|uniref:heme lyase CcmF/NrfE family subunit n=1 Tax=Salinisphaera sp. SPP-AMP-43 TaxID=3121288 RepID=UPI003C6E2951